MVDLLSPKVGMLEGNQGEAEKAEGLLSLRQFEPTLRVTPAEENRIFVDSKTWEADISYLARADFDGKGLEEILIPVRGPI